MMLLYTVSFLDPRFTIYLTAIKEKITQEGLWYATDNNSNTDTVTSATESAKVHFLLRKNPGKYFKEK